MSKYLITEPDGTIVIKAKRNKRGIRVHFSATEERAIRDALIGRIDNQRGGQQQTCSTPQPCMKLNKEILKINSEVVELRKEFMKLKKKHDTKGDKLEVLLSQLYKKGNCNLRLN